MRSGDRPDGTGVRDALHVAVTPPLPDEIHTLLYQDLVYGSGWPDRPTVLRVEGYVASRPGVCRSVRCGWPVALTIPVVNGYASGLSGSTPRCRSGC